MSWTITLSLPREDYGGAPLSILNHELLIACASC